MKINSKSAKKLSSPYSTGGGGEHFEAYVQTSFAVLMLTRGFAPCLPNCPINKLIFQGRVNGYETDDLIVFVDGANSGAERKLLMQIKHSITISKKDTVFKEVIQAAWNDFNNENIFTKDKDQIALVTGPLGKKDIDHTRRILEWARNCNTSNEFFSKVQQAKFSSDDKRKKLDAFRVQITMANGGAPVPDETVFKFLRHFHLLSYDLDIKAGLNLSLLYSLMSTYTQENVGLLWSKLVNDVEDFNHNAGTLSIDNIPDDWQTAFKSKFSHVIPENLLPHPHKPEDSQIDWNQHEYASDLAIAILVGSWNDNNDPDRVAIGKLAHKDYSLWINNISELLHVPSSPIKMNSGKWKIKARLELWKSLGCRILDDDLTLFAELATEILGERDPKFDLPVNDRYAAAIYNKVPKYSSKLRHGLAESLALMSTHSADLTQCSLNKRCRTPVTVVKSILTNANWEIWASLEHLLSFMAEAAPDAYLKIVEKTFQHAQGSIEKLFSSEGSSMSSQNYSLGLRWSLEVLAWDEEYLVRVCSVLASIEYFFGGNHAYANFHDTICTILLPWYPQTRASIKKRKVAVDTLIKEFPLVAWKTLRSLLPKEHSVSNGTSKPSYFLSIPKNWNSEISNIDYWDQTRYYAEKLVELANSNIERLTELVSVLNKLPTDSFEKALEYLAADAVVQASEEKRLPLWSELKYFTIRHRRSSDANWSFDEQTLKRIDAIADKLQPLNPLKLHQRLFSINKFSLYQHRGNWKEQDEAIERERIEALNKIIAYGGTEAIIQFAESVENGRDVGRLFGTLEAENADAIILPDYLDSEHDRLREFTKSYILNRRYKYGWEWADSLDKSGWSIKQIALFLSYLPVSQETWDRASKWLGKSEKEYWIRARPIDSQDLTCLGIAVDNFLKYGQPAVAIMSLHNLLIHKQPLDKERCIKALLELSGSPVLETSVNQEFIHNIREIITALQDDPDTRYAELRQIEWIYLPILGRFSGVRPRSLELCLASDPEFFCDVLRMCYRTKDEVKKRKEPSKSEKANASHVWELFHNWKTVPGTLEDGTFSDESFTKWLEAVKENASHLKLLDIAMRSVGKVLLYTPADSEGLWIRRSVAEALNDPNADDMREGYELEAFNSRGVCTVDPTGKQERELAEEYRQKASDVEDAGYHRFAVTLRNLAKASEQIAEEDIARHLGEDE